MIGLVGLQQAASDAGIAAGAAHHLMQQLKRALAARGSPLLKPRSASTTPTRLSSGK